MTSTRDELTAKLWRDIYPSHQPRAYDPQGWNSRHPYLTEAINRRPRIVVEIGVWKGASVLTMARRMRSLNLDAAIIAIDTWLGSAEHWLSGCHDRGMFDLFMSNIAAEELQDYVVPFPIDTASACDVLRHLDIHPDLIHLDAAHDYLSVTMDLHRWFPMLRPGGEMVIDDYGSPAWPQVASAVGDYLARNAHRGFAAEQCKCRFEAMTE